MTIRWRCRMPVSYSPMIRGLGLTAALAGFAHAQATKGCEINEGRPAAVGRATYAVQIAQSANPETAARQLSAAVKSLTENVAQTDNPVGRNFVLGKALVLWTMQPNIGLTSKRGPLGYTTDPEGTIDLAAAIDTAF